MTNQNIEINERVNQSYNTANILQLRLDSSLEKVKIETFLKGTKYEYIQLDDGKVQSQEIVLGKPKANKEGILAILMNIEGIFNPQVVQGNFEREDFDNYIREVNIDLAVMITVNADKWEIRDEDIDPIIDFIIHLMIPFMSRTIDNKERESYSDSLRHVEKSEVKGKGNILPDFSNSRG
jgi:hypothetical protein